MIKEAKHIDFYTSGKEPSVQDFARISDWIHKKKKNASLPKQSQSKEKSIS